MSSEDYRLTYRNHLEVVVQYYKDLEDELRGIRQSYEVELRRLNCIDAIRELDNVE